MAHGLEIRYKRDFHLIRWAIWTSIVLIIGLGGWYTYKYFTTGDLPPGVTVRALEADPSVDETPVSDDAISSYTVASDLPRYVSIEKLGIGNTRVYSVGVDINNILESPSNINDAAWYSKSAKPGQGYGAVLIDAHNGGVTKDGVFAKLGTLQKNDEITVERGDGKKLTYKVVENESVSLDEVNKTGMKKMLLPVDPTKEGLNLITCDGKWVPQIKQFDRRVMLRAVLSSE